MPADLQLAIETSGRVGSVALLHADQPLQQVVLPRDQRTAAALHVAIERLLHQQHRQATMIQAISVVAGPGSFTGLRIGVTAAKTLAYALKVPLVAVDTLSVIAAQAYRAAEVPGGQVPKTLQIAINAYRGQVFTRRCQNRDPLSGSSEVQAAEQWSVTCREVSATAAVAIVADAKLQTRGIAQPAAPAERGLWITDPTITQPFAETVGQLAWRQSTAGQVVDPFKLKPWYLRPSAAEEKATAPTDAEA